MVDDVIEVWLIFDLHLIAIVLHQGCENLLVCSLVPFVAVVLEFDVMGLGLTVLAIDDGTVLNAECPTGHFAVTACEGLFKIGHSPDGSKALFIELGQLVEVELALQEACRVLPMADLLLEQFLLLDEADTVDTLVHTDRVLPVVRALGVLRIILDAHSLVSPHVTDHDILFDFTRLVTGFVLCVATLLDAVARQIAAGAARIANGHGEGSRHIALQRYGCPFLRLHRHILL